MTPCIEQVVVVNDKFTDEEKMGKVVAKIPSTCFLNPSRWRVATDKEEWDRQIGHDYYAEEISEPKKRNQLVKEIEAW